MNKQSSFDRGLLIPIGVGIFSLVGICVILLGGRIFASRADIEAPPTATYFEYALVGTEPAIVTTTLETPVTEAPAAETEAPSFLTATPGPLFTQPALTPTAIVLRTNTPAAATNVPTRTPTSASTAPFGPGTYDDVNDKFVYTGNWQSVPGATYENTLHVSSTLGNSVAFRFIGQELYVVFQAGQSLGMIRLTLDGVPYDMDESKGSGNVQWLLPMTTSGVHMVTIRHLSGGSVNLNYIIVPEVSVTPTSTATSTSQ